MKNVTKKNGHKNSEKNKRVAVRRDFNVEEKKKEQKRVGRKLHEDTLTMQNYLRTLSPGDTRSYLMIEEESGVVMDDMGRYYLRSAAKRNNLEYITIHGYGIKLVDEHSGLEAVGKRIHSIDSSLKRAEQTVHNVRNQFYEKMSEEDKKALRFVTSTFGTIRLMAEDSNKIFGPSEVRKIPDSISIPIPSFAEDEV